MTLDKKLARLRKREGLSQAEVSEKLDVSRQAVSRWESGEARPSTDNLQAHVSSTKFLWTICLMKVKMNFLFRLQRPRIQKKGQNGRYRIQEGSGSGGW